VTEISPSVFIFSALVCEAKPLIDDWKLKKIAHPGVPFAMYTNAERVVVVSGIGKVAMAGAVAFAMAWFKVERLPVLVNIGIAGHRQAELGQLFLAHKVIDHETGRGFYPQLPFEVTCETCTVKTFGKPCDDYEDGVLVEMEAAGFYETAVKFSSSELIQVVKVVSDNVKSPVSAINESTVAASINSRLSVVDKLISRLISIRQPVQMSDLPHPLLAKYHLTVTNALKLTALLQRWYLLKGIELDVSTANAGNARELIGWLENQLDETEFYL
jgi:adenosylhomocysteine nucleosidase